VDVMALACVY